MGITATQFRETLEKDGLNHRVLGEDKYGDFQVRAGISTDRYLDRDGDEGIQFIIELTEGRETKRQNLEELIAKIERGEASRDELVELAKQAANPQVAEKTYEYIRFLAAPIWVPEQISSRSREEKIDAANRINLQLKLTNLVVDSDGDFIYSYGIPLEDSTVFTARQIRRMMSLISNLADKIYEEFGIE